MPPGRRRIPTPSRDVIIPLALGLTAAIATVGLYLWPDPESSYSSGSSGDEREKERVKHRKLKTRRQFLEHDRITEEDTDDFEEDRQRDEKLKLKGKQPNTMMSGALQLGGAVESAVSAVVGGAVGAVVGRRDSDAIKAMKAEAATNTQQFVPPPPKKKSVAIVVSERKALEGHDSDSDYEEAGLPSVRLTLPSKWGFVLIKQTNSLCSHIFLFPSICH